MQECLAVAVVELTQVGEARRAMVALAGTLGFDEVQTGKAALVVTEAAGNLVKHGGGGVILLRPVDAGTLTGVEMLALDKGPGIANLARCLGDGFSTTGTPGTGLGAIFRLSAFADVYSGVSSGTAVLARLWPRGLPAGRGRFQTGAVSVPKPGEEVCGDAWTIIEDGGRALILVVDGLGHGPHAAEAALAAIRLCRTNARLGPAAVLEAAHRGLRGTRGAAAGIAEVDADAEVLRYAGVGNVAGAILVNGTSRSLVSHNGIVGHEAYKFQEFTYPFPTGALLVMNSDGLLSRWGLDPYPGLALRDPSLVAGILFRDYPRGRDDVTVLAARARTEEPSA